MTNIKISFTRTTRSIYIYIFTIWRRDELSEERKGRTYSIIESWIGKMNTEKIKSEGMNYAKRRLPYSNTTLAVAGLAAAGAAVLYYYSFYSYKKPSAADYREVPKAATPPPPPPK